MSDAEKRPVKPNLNWKDLCAILDWLGWIMRLIDYGLNKYAFFKVVKYLAEIAVLVSLLIYFYQGSARDRQAEQMRLQAVLNAWQILSATCRGEAGSSKKKALEFLNKTGVDLNFLNVRYEYLCGIDLSNARLTGADFADSTLTEADFRNADLRDARFQHTGLRGADLREAKNLTSEQLCNARTLFKAKLDSELLEKVKVECPELLEKPERVK